MTLSVQFPCLSNEIKSRGSCGFVTGANLQLRKFLEEVSVKSCRYTREQCCVYAFTLKNAIDVGAVAINFPCKPGGGTFLSLEFCLDELANVYHKGRNYLLKTYLQPRYRQVTIVTDKHK